MAKIRYVEGVGRHGGTSGRAGVRPRRSCATPTKPSAASVGGIEIVPLYLQGRRGWSAGLEQMVVEVIICGAGVFITDAKHVALSLISAFAAGAVMFAYHR